ncbi:hypothetical protein N8940_00715 [Sphingomonadaceae bacterium]|nr:hypothetical protein [Sphingomonadaceae bacterium]
MQDHPLWNVEERFWKHDGTFAADHLAANCIMALPGLELIQDEALRDVLANRLHTDDFSFGCQNLVRPSKEAAMLSYSLIARRSGLPDYTCVCSSGYIRGDGLWRMYHHQQTPTG